MTDYASQSPDKLDNHSTVFEKTTPQERIKIDRAIIDRDPATYRAIFKVFKLIAKGFSFTSFYYYARRIRHHATARNLTELIITEPGEVPRALPDILAGLIVEHMQFTDEVSPNVIHRLTQSYKIALTGRHLLDLEAAKRAKEPDRQAELRDSHERDMQLIQMSGLAEMSQLKLRAAELQIDELNEKLDRVRQVFERAGMDPNQFLNAPLLPSEPEPPDLSRACEQAESSEPEAQAPGAVFSEPSPSDRAPVEDSLPEATDPPQSDAQVQANDKNQSPGQACPGPSSDSLSQLG